MKMNADLLKEHPIDLVLSCNKLQERVLLNYEQHYTVVNEDWLEVSIRKKICRYPEDYALNEADEEFWANPGNYLKTLSSHVDGFKDCDVSDEAVGCLHGSAIYLGEGLTPEVNKLLRRAIPLLGGCHLDLLLPVLTHVVCGSVTQETYAEYKKYGELVQVVKL